MCHERIDSTNQLFLFTKAPRQMAGNVVVYNGLIGAASAPTDNSVPEQARSSSEQPPRRVHPALDAVRKLAQLRSSRGARWLTVVGARMACAEHRGARKLGQQAGGDRALPAVPARQRADRQVTRVFAVGGRLKVGRPRSAEMIGTKTKALTEGTLGVRTQTSILAQALAENQIGHVRLESSSRQNAILRFRTDPDIKVFMLNATSQSSGLTLVAATHVFLVEPILNPAMELQVQTG